jgi:hypothetical protein
MAPIGQMDKATQLNHWVALTAELEESREAIARAVYKMFKAGKIHDDNAMECCRRIDGLYDDAKEFEHFLQEDFKTYLGDNTKPGIKVTGAEKAKKKAMSLFARWHIHRNVNSYKRNFRENFLDLGSRTVQAYEDGTPLTGDPTITNMVKYALRCQKEADRRWEEVQILSKEDGRGGNPFLTAVQGLVMSLTAYASTNSVPWLKKALKQDAGVQQKIREQYRKGFQALKKDTSVKVEPLR